MQQNAYKCTALKYSLYIIFFMIVARLFYLQINLSSYFSQKSKNNYIRLEKVYSPRGNILDCNGELLATNRPVTNLYWQGTGNSSLQNAQHAIIAKLKHILNVDLMTQTTLQSISYAEKYYQKFLIAADMSLEQLSQISEQFPDNLNLEVTTHFKRHYPCKSLASHVLGYLGKMDVEQYGRMGLEKLLEAQLRGKDGLIIKTINSVGRSLEKQEIEEVFFGNSIHTTIDLDLQQLCEKIFPHEFAGTILLMDPFHGDIKSLISRPHFDPELFLNSLSHNDWIKLQEKNPFINRACSAAYPPGSIFKLVTICAALEHNMIEPESTWICNGFVTFGNRKYWCADHKGHGELNTMQSVALSCNTIFFEIGKHIDIDLLAQYANKFGFGKKTDIIFPEKTGLVPTKQWKQEIKGEKWWPGETLSATIGQSFLLVTPIQVARMIASIFTEHLVKPRILCNEPIVTTPLDIKPSTLAFLRRSMKSVVTAGTGKKINKIKDIEIYAKTSTAQTSMLYKRKLGSQYLEHGWFVAYFIYKQMPPLVLVILVEHAGTAQIATTIAKNFLVEYKKLVDTSLSYH